MTTEDKLAQALRTIVDRNFTFFCGSMLGADRKITRDEVLAARATLAEYDSAQASKSSGDSAEMPSVTDAGPWTLTDGGSIQSADFKHDVVLSIGGDFASKAERLAYAKGLCAQINAGCALANPTERQGQKPEAAVHGQCRKCGGAMAAGIATGQTMHCGREGTCSPAGPGYVMDCLKCSVCGWSITPPQAAPDRVGGGDV